MLRRHPKTVVVWLAACSEPGLLADAPIVGADSAYVERVAAAVERFEAATGEGRVRVKRLEVRDLDDFDGSWDSRSGVIEIGSGLDDDDLEAIVRHELCHALDWNEGPFYLDHEQVYEDLSLRDPFAWKARATDGCDSHDRCPPGEVFASMCEYGPAAAFAYQAPCVEEDPDFATVMSHLTDVVWVESNLMGRAARGPQLAEYPVAPGALDVQDAQGTVNQSHAYLRYHHTDSEFDQNSVILVDVLTGVNVTSTVTDEDRVPLGAPHAHPPGLPLPAFHSSNWVGWEADGPASGLSLVDFYHFGELYRQLWTDGAGGWAIVDDGCEMVPEPFTGDGSILALERTEDSLAWRRIDWN